MRKGGDEEPYIVLSAERVPKGQGTEWEFCPGFLKASVLPVSCACRQVGKGRCSL